MTDDPLRSFKGIWLAMWLGLAIFVAIGMGVSGCATQDPWMGVAGKDFRHAPVPVHSDPLTWRPYQNYRQPECEICGKSPTQWSHELPQCDYKELVNDPDNGHSLCRACHVFFHYQNTSRYWTDNMDELIEVIKANKRSYKKYENTTDKP